MFWPRAYVLTFIHKKGFSPEVADDIIRRFDFRADSHQQILEADLPVVLGSKELTQEIKRSWKDDPSTITEAFAP